MSAERFRGAAFPAAGRGSALSAVPAIRIRANSRITVEETA